MSRSIYLLLCISTTAYCSQNLPPALLWGEAINAPLIGGQVLATPKNVADEITSDSVVVFLLDKLSLEDFGKFSNLKTIVANQESVFLPEIDSMLLIDTLKKQNKSVKVIYLETIEDVETSVKEIDYSKKVGILTAKQSSWALSRSKRDVPKGDYVIGEDFIVYLKRVNLTVPAAGSYHTVTYDGPGEVKKVSSNATDFSLSFGYGQISGTTVKINSFSVEMNFKKRGGYFKLNEISAKVDGTAEQKSLSINEKLMSAVDLLFPVKSSFHCTKFGPMKVPMNSTLIRVVFHKFQIQLDKNDTKFLPVYECVGFFTPGIWMGIFMNLILISILSWGIYMIMSLKTMDRFDDPKGKPISFAGNE